MSANTAGLTSLSSLTPLSHFHRGWWTEPDVSPDCWMCTTHHPSSFQKPPHTGFIPPEVVTSENCLTLEHSSLQHHHYRFYCLLMFQTAPLLKQGILFLLAELPRTRGHKPGSMKASPQCSLSLSPAGRFLC